MKKFVNIFLVLMLSFSIPAWGIIGVTIEPGVYPSGIVSTDNSIVPSKLKAIDGPSDSECLTYDLATGNFEWATCGAGGGISNLVEDTTPQLGGTLDLNGKAIDNVSQTEFSYLDGVTSAIQTQLNLKAPIASPTFTGIVTINGPGQLSSDNVAITGGTVSGLSSLGVTGTSSLAIANISDNATIVDDKPFRLGTDGDYITYFKSSTGQHIFSTTLDGSTMTDTDPAWYYDFAVGGTADSGQRLFGWGVNGTPACYGDEAGNLTCTGTGTFASLGTTCSATDNTCGYNGANVGWPAYSAEGEEGYNMTLDEKGVYDNTVGIAAYRYGHNDAICFVIDGGGSAITTGQKGHLEIPFNAWITQVTTLADQSGSIVVDIWKDTYANFPPADADSITASAPPTLSTAQKAQDSTLTGWTKTITAGEILAYNVDSATTVTRVTVCLKVKK